MERRDIGWGLTLIFLGIGFGGDAVGFWEARFFLEAGWVLFVIVPCLIHIFERGIQRSNLIVLGIGIGAAVGQWFPRFQDFSVAYVLILVGVILLRVPRLEKR